MRKLEKAGIQVLPASVRYHSPKATGVEPEQVRSPSPDIILRRDNDFLRTNPPHDWDANEHEQDEDQKVPDVQRDDLASRRARMNQARPVRTHHFLPTGCSSKDRERWEGIRLASQLAVLERMEKMEQEKMSEADSASSEVSIITRKDNLFLTPRGKKRSEEEEGEEGKEVGGGQSVVPNLYKDDLARRRSQGGTTLQKDPRQSLAQTNITQSDLEKWQRLSRNTENSEASPAEVSLITHKDNTFLTPEKVKERKDEEEKLDNEGETEGRERVVVPNIQKDDLARRRGQTGGRPQQDPRQALLQTAITQSDLEKWQRLKMSTEDSDSPPAPLCQACLEKGSILAASSVKVARGELAAGRGRSHGDRRRFVTFGGVTEVESVSWKEGEEEEEEEKEKEERRRESKMDESDKLQSLLSTATVAMPTTGMSSGLTAERAVDSGGENAAAASTLSFDSPQPITSDVKSSSALIEREVLELRLAEKARDEKEYEEQEEEEERERQPDLENDDMMTRRTGTFQKGTGGKSFNQFLPLPGFKRDTAGSGQKESSQLCRGVAKDPLMLEKNIKTKRFKIGQRWAC
ncbi:uncharacterized protein [Hoplias malabaricus]|uniref:uncharacterized protein n=1 Tax=Hoplias malabaricus TaxID=27720 RepID=UPI003461CE64